MTINENCDLDLTQCEFELLNNADEDNFLIKKIKNVILGDVHPNPEGDTVEEQAQSILKTIFRQLQSNETSREGIGYLAHCFGRKLQGESNTLDEAFYVSNLKTSGGQPTKTAVERATVKAFMAVIRKKTWTFDKEYGEYIYELPTKDDLRIAYKAAFDAYRAAVGKDADEYGEPEKKINQTIKPLLKRMGVFR